MNKAELNKAEMITEPSPDHDEHRGEILLPVVFLYGESGSAEDAVFIEKSFPSFLV